MIITIPFHKHLQYQDVQSKTMTE